MAIIVEDVACVVKPRERVTIKVDNPHVLENTVPCGSILVPYYVDLVLFLVSRWFQVITPRIGVKLRRLPMITTHGTTRVFAPVFLVEHTNSGGPQNI